jgi:hypothetical protein
MRGLREPIIRTAQRSLQRVLDLFKAEAFQLFSIEVFKDRRDVTRKSSPESPPPDNPEERLGTSESRCGLQRRSDVPRGLRVAGLRNLQFVQKHHESTGSCGAKQVW